jgi:hypothetical protein
MSIQAESMHSPRDKRSMEVRVIFLVCFVPALFHVVAMRCLHGRKPASSTILNEAKAAAYTCVSFAFMG